MATRVTSTKSSTKRDTRFGGGKPPGPNGKGPKGNGWHGGKDDSPRKLSPAAYRITMWIVLAAVVMMFAALSSVYIVLSFENQDQRVKMPRLFFVSTAIILFSSITFGWARRSLKQGRLSGYRKWISTTLFLGLIFLTVQLMGWQELAAQGAYFVGSPHSSFFYFFTGVHGVHLLGGIAGLVYLLVRMKQDSILTDLETSQNRAGVVSLYWHTMDGLWIWLFLLLLIWG